MTFPNYTIIPDDEIVILGDQAATGVSMTGIPSDVHAITWNSLSETGRIDFKTDPGTGVTPPPETFLDPADYEAQVLEAEAIIDARNNPVRYYFTAETTFQGTDWPVGGSYLSTEVGHPAPPNTTTLVPPLPAIGQTVQWDGSAWVLASFDITLSLPQAKASLIQDVTTNGAAAVNSEISLYSTVQQIEAPSVVALDAKTYPGTTIGDYQTYIDGQIATATATINAAVSVGDLYTFNPAEVPYAPASNGVIFTGRGSGLGPLDMNVSYFVEWNSTTVDESDTELYAPATGMIMPYGSGGAGKFDSAGNAFTLGNYTIQIRQASTGFVLAEYECPLAPSGVNVNF